jgi:hypothetical protein
MVKTCGADVERAVIRVLFMKDLPDDDDDDDDDDDCVCVCVCVCVGKNTVYKQGGWIPSSGVYK